MKIYLRCSTCNFQIFVKSAPGDEITPVLKFDVLEQKSEKERCQKCEMIRNRQIKY